MRYAIYFMPSAATQLWRFGASVLGYDAFTGLSVPFPEHPVFSRAQPPAWIAEPQRYGFHATLKAPFELAPGAREADVHATAASLARSRQSFLVPGLGVRAMSRFVALMPAAPVPELDDLASACVRRFEPVRGPISAADRQRRLAAPLTARQIRHLDTWGYPYVMEDFQFHMTLAGPLQPDALQTVQSALALLWAPINAPLLIDAITVAVQPARDARFLAQARYTFADA